MLSNDDWVDLNRKCTLIEVAGIIMERLSIVYFILLPERKTTFPLE